MTRFRRRQHLLNLSRPTVHSHELLYQTRSHTSEHPFVKDNVDAVKLRRPLFGTPTSTCYQRKQVQRKKVVSVLLQPRGYCGVGARLWYTAARELSYPPPRMTANADDCRRLADRVMADVRYGRVGTVRSAGKQNRRARHMERVGRIFPLATEEKTVIEVQQSARPAATAMSATKTALLMAAAPAALKPT